MNTSRIALALLLAGSGATLHVALAQQPAGIKRSELQREDLVVPGREVVQVRVELEPGLVFECHKHPGDEIIYSGNAAELATYIVEIGKPLVRLGQ